jgi:hypothetical protein
MKKLLFTACVLAITLQSCKKGNIESTIPADTTEVTDTTNNALLASIKKEPKVKDAFVNDANVLYVAVAADGTDRSGYAEYLCEIVRENKSDIERIKIVEYGTSGSKDADNAYGKLLGESQCEK